MSTSELRRIRLEAMEQEQDLRDRAQTNAPQSFIGTIAGSPGTSVPAYFKVQPQSISGTATEGGSATVTARTIQPILVYVIGPSVPTLGQKIMCWRAGGAWVGETCCGKGCFNCYPCSACSGFHSCGGTLTDDNGTYPLHLFYDNFSGTIGWVTDTLSVATNQCLNDAHDGLVDGTLQYLYLLRCNGTNIEFALATNWPSAITGDCFGVVCCPPLTPAWQCGGLFGFLGQQGNFGSNTILWFPTTIAGCDPPSGTASLPPLGVKHFMFESCPPPTPVTLEFFPLTPPSVGFSYIFDTEPAHDDACCCLPCQIPKQSLVLTLPDESLVPLDYHEPCMWLSPCIDTSEETASSSRFALECQPSANPANTIIVLNFQTFGDALCTSLNSSTRIAELIAWTCSPFHLDFRTPGGTHYYVDGTCECCVTVIATGCNGLPIQGAFIEVKSGGTRVGSASTVTNGRALINIVTSGTYDVVLTKMPRWAVTTLAARLLNCGDTVPITASPAPGYQCLAGCVDPVSETIASGWPGAGMQVFAWNGVAWAVAFSLAGHDYIMVIRQDGILVISRDDTICFSGSLAIIQCPDAGFFAQVSLPPGDCATELGSVGTFSE